MRVAVVGHEGMLGHCVADECVEHGYIVYKPHRYEDTAPSFMYDIDIIVNCAGVIPQRSIDRRAMIYSNAMLPHSLAKHEIPMIHVSTDCVFSGNLDMGRQYGLSYTLDAITDYGRTKALGEVQASHVCNVRTSFIGARHGLQKWLTDQPQGALVSGWYNTAWSGSTVEQVARALVLMIPGMFGGEYRNIEHLATLKPMTKYDLLVHLAKKYNPTVRISCDQLAVPINRALAPSIELPSVFTCLA